MFLGDNGPTLDVLKRLRALGVGIALDDFGTGYSSIGYLNKAVFHKLKIDGSFVREAGSRPENVAIIQSIVQLAKSFRMSITAEGVETAEDFERMRDLGCDTIQGYLFGRPLPYDRANEMVVGLGSEAPGRLILRLPRLPVHFAGQPGGQQLDFAAKSSFKYQSGRVIALGRIMLAGMFLVAIWLDPSQPPVQSQIYAFLWLYLCFALAVAAATWTNWWLEFAAGRPDPFDRHGGVRGHRLFDQRLHQPLLPGFHPAASVGGNSLGMARNRADRGRLVAAVLQRRNAGCGGG